MAAVILGRNDGSEVEILNNIAKSDMRPAIIFDANPARYYYDNDIVLALHSLFKVGYSCPLAVSKSGEVMRDVDKEDLYQLVCKPNGAKTVVLVP